MKKILLVSLVVLLVFGLTGLSVHYYQERKPKPGITTAQALRQRDEARSTLAVTVAKEQATQDSLKQQATDLQTKLSSVCASLKLTKVVNLNCSN